MARTICSSSGANGSPNRPTTIRPSLVRIDRLGLELGSEGRFKDELEGDDPLNATVEMRQTQSISRDAWRTRIETQMRMSCTSDDFVLSATLQAWEGDVQVCNRNWNYRIPRDFA